MTTKTVSSAALLILFPVLSCAQALTQPGTLPADPPASPSGQGRIFWIVPNYRTSPSLAHYEPLTAREKFNLTARDAFDPGTFALAGIFAGENHLAHSQPSFGQGAAGYGRYYATAYSDLVIGDFFTEALYPSLLHQDPRYFRKGSGSGWSRVGYAVGQLIFTHGDNGRRQFNYSEIAGNATAVALSNAYYPDHRTAGNASAKFSVQLGVDAASNILKEFWPDLDRKFFHRKTSGD